MKKGTITERELRSQPEAWRRLRDRAHRADLLPDLGLGAYDEILFFGSGSSYYLAASLADSTERVLGVPARALPSCELVMLPDRHLARAARRIAIGISRSGESTEVVVASERLRERAVPVVAVTCRPEAAWAQAADHLLPVPEGHEDGLVMLRSFTSMLLAFQTVLAREAGTAPPPLEELARAASRIVDERWQPLGDLVRRGNFAHHVILGSGAAYEIAREAALKLQEMAITSCEAFHALEYRHGPKSTAGPGSLIVLLAIDEGEGYEEDLLGDLKEQGVTTLVVGDAPGRFGTAADLAVDVATGLPADRHLPLLLLPCQILAFETALHRGRNPDAPPNLTSVVRLP